MPEEQEYKPISKPKKTKSIQECLANTKNMHFQKESSTSKKHGKSLSTIGEGVQVKMQLNETGSRHGVTASSSISNGEIISVEVQMGAHGLPTAPTLTERDWQSVDLELDTEDSEYPRINKVSLKAEKLWMLTLLQGSAAIRVAPKEHIITRLARLKTIKQTKNMDEAQSAVFFEEITNMLHSEGFCYTAIDEGIMRLIKREKDKWFPGPQKLIEYIYPIHWKLKRRIDKLHEILTRPHQNKLIE